MCLTSLKDKLYGVVLALVTSTMLSSCGLGELFDRYEQVSLTPDMVATFSSFDSRDCAIDPTLDTSAIPTPPAQFSGIGEAGVGHSGRFVANGEQKIHTMHTAIKFNLGEAPIPASSASETMVANLVFIYNLTPRSTSDSRCNVRITGGRHRLDELGQHVQFQSTVGQQTIYNRRMRADLRISYSGRL